MEENISYVGLDLKSPGDAEYIQNVLEENFGKRFRFLPVTPGEGSVKIDFLIRDMSEPEKISWSERPIPEQIPFILFIDGQDLQLLHAAIRKHPFNIWLKGETTGAEIADTISRLIGWQNWIDELSRMRKAIEISPVSMLITDSQGEIIYVNPQLEKESGYPAAELIGQNPRILKSGVHGPEFYNAIWQKISTGQIWEGEICNKKKDGKLYWEKQMIIPAFNNRNEITHFISLKMDDTDRRRAEEALRKAETLKSVKELAGGIAHEFSQPLQVLTISMSILEMQLDGNELFLRCQRMIQRIIDLVANLKNITELKQQDYLQTKILDLKKSSVKIEDTAKTDLQKTKR